VIAAQAGQALHVLDRFHITSHLNQAVDQVRRAESTRLRSKSKAAGQRLKHMRWPLLRRASRVRGRARQKLNALLVSKLATARAWELKEPFSHFWHYRPSGCPAPKREKSLPGYLAGAVRLKNPASAPRVGSCHPLQ
jgi:transposase